MNSSVFKDFKYFGADHLGYSYFYFLKVLFNTQLDKFQQLSCLSVVLYMSHQGNKVGYCIANLLCNHNVKFYKVFLSGLH